MKIFFAYPNRSCVSGKALRQSLRAKKKMTNKKAKCDLLIRYGSAEEFSNLKFKKEINTRAAVLNATNKLRSLQLLTEAGLPCISFSSNPEVIETFRNEEGFYYIRNRSGVVRYGNDYNSGTDSYASLPVVNKRREYRVHVFQGRVIGLYEKIPLEEERPKLYKSHTCRFERKNPENCKLTLENQQACIRAVEVLGLDFAGVDVIRDKDQNIFICEVNSAPGLNTKMVEVYTEEFKRVLGELE